jgi:hypothetical protein
VRNNTVEVMVLSSLLKGQEEELLTPFQVSVNKGFTKSIETYAGGGKLFVH